MYKKVDWLVAVSARSRRPVDRETARNFFMFTLILGLIGAVLQAVAAIGRFFGH
jgi:hypothetical protein